MILLICMCTYDPIICRCNTQFESFTLINLAFSSLETSVCKHSSMRMKIKFNTIDLLIIISYYFPLLS